MEFEYSTNQLIRTNVDGVIEELKEAGFYNYKTIANDIYPGNSKFVGEVEQVVVDGKSWIEAGTMVPYDAEIIVTYHLKKEFVFLYSLHLMAKRNYEDLVQELLEVGFTEVYTLPLNDLKTGLIHKEYSVQQVGIVGVESIKKGMILEYDRKIIIEGKSFENPYLLLAINPANHITADATINIRTNVLTCSFHLNERMTASPITAMIIGRSIKRLTASLLNTLYAIYAKAATSTSDTTASIMWNNPAYSICDLYTTGIAIEKNMRYTSENHSNMLSSAIALFLAVLMTRAAIRNPYDVNCIPGIVYSVCTIPETRITPIVIHIIFVLTCVPSDTSALRKSLLIVNNKITDAASDRIQMPFTYRLNPSPHIERFLSANERMRLWILSLKRIRK